jgi:hypothetical protein
MVVGKVKGNPFSSSRLKCIIGSGGFGIPPCMERYQLILKLFKISWLLVSGFILTRYCNIKGSATVGSMFPTITTVKAEGSLKHLLKYSQALRGSTFCKSHFLIGCITNMLKVKSSLFGL